MELYGLSSSTCLQSVQAHEGPIWSICIKPDQRGLVSASADNDLKFWNFELVEDESFSKVCYNFFFVYVRAEQREKERGNSELLFTFALNMAIRSSDNQEAGHCTR